MSNSRIFGREASKNGADGVVFENVVAFRNIIVPKNFVTKTAIKTKIWVNKKSLTIFALFGCRGEGGRVARFRSEWGGRAARFLIENSVESSGHEVELSDLLS